MFSMSIIDDSVSIIDDSVSIIDDSVSIIDDSVSSIQRLRIQPLGFQSVGMSLLGILSPYHLSLSSIFRLV